MSSKASEHFSKKTRALLMQCYSVPDRVVSFVLKKAFPLLRKSGRIFCTQVSHNNPDRVFMDWWGNWRLIERDESELEYLSGCRTTRETVISSSGRYSLRDHRTNRDITMTTRHSPPHQMPDRLPGTGARTAPRQADVQASRFPLPASCFPRPVCLGSTGFSLSRCSFS